MAANPEAQEKIQRLTIIEQNMQQLLHQKQQFGSQAFEVESALKEISTTKSAYKIIGNIMVQQEKDTLQRDLADRKEMIALRIQTIEKQEAALKEKAKKLQEEVMGALKE